MALFKRVLWILVIGSVFVIVEKKTGLFTWLLTAGGRFNNPLVS